MLYPVKVTIAISNGNEVTYKTFIQNVNANSKEEAEKIINDSQVWIYAVDCEEQEIKK